MASCAASTTCSRSGGYFASPISTPRTALFTATVSMATRVSTAPAAAKAAAAGFADVRFTTAYEMHKEAGGRMRTFPIFLMVAVKA